MTAPLLNDILPSVMAGFLIGGLYAMLSLGLSLIFGVMKLINLAHGEFVVLGSYLGYALLIGTGIDPILAIGIVAPILFGIGFVIQKYLMNRVFRMGLEPPLLIAFGLSIMLQNVYLIVWTPLSRALTTSYSLATLKFGDLFVPQIYLLDFLGALVIMLSLRGFLSRTYLGMAIRASSQDRVAAQLVGINTNQVFALTFGIAMGLAGVAGIFLGMTFPFTPSSGSAYLIIAFGVVVIGGLGSMFGTFVGGLVLGLAQTLGSYFFGVGYGLFIGYVVIIAILALKPEGLFKRSR